MDFAQIKELINTIENSSFRELKLTQEQTQLYLSKNGSNSAITDNTFAQPKIEQNMQTNIVPNTPITVLPEKATPKEEGNLVRSPLVGTFFASSSPDKPPFVKVGDKVKKGDVVCIIEAMKVMNEIRSQFDGEVSKILAENDSLVEYNQPIICIL